MAVGLAAAVFVLLGPQGGVASGASRGTLVVSAGQGDKTPISTAEVYVDGERRCRALPCRLDDLTAGPHLVRVNANGYAATTERAVLVDSARESTFHAELMRTAAPAPGAPPKAEPAAEAPAPETPAPAPAQAELLDADQLPDPSEKRETARRAPERRATPERPSSRSASRLAAAMAAGSDREEKVAKPENAADSPGEQAAPDAKGIINISATPPAFVAVNGRPLGKTPKTVRVSPGIYTVVLASDEGRRVTTVDVEPGATKSVSAKFGD